MATLGKEYLNKDGDLVTCPALCQDGGEVIWSALSQDGSSDVLHGETMFSEPQQEF